MCIVCKLDFGLSLSMMFTFWTSESVSNVIALCIALVKL